VPGPDGALWFPDNGGSSIGRITTTGSITQYPLPAGDTAFSIAGAFDGALWFTDPTTNSIGRMTTSGAVTEHPVPTASAGLSPIVSGPDTALWFTEATANKIGRISLQGAVTEYSLPTPGSVPNGITPGPDGALWFDENRGYIGRITTGGIISEHRVSSPPNFIVTGSDKALWFLIGNSSNQQLARMTTNGAVTSYPAYAPYIPGGLISGPDGALWYTSSTCGSICLSSLTRTTTNGQSTTFDLRSLGSASVEGLASGPDGAIWLFSDSGGYGSSSPRVIRAG
jgi:virginiamycin B lyase